MKTLADMSAPGSPAAVYLPDMDYDPGRFKALLESYNLKKDVYYLYEAPLKEIPKLINKGHLSGYLKYRLEISK